MAAEKLSDKFISYNRRSNRQQFAGPMPVPNKIAYVSAEQYLSMEERASVRHEYVGGQVFAMAGATKRHNVIALNIGSILRSHVTGSQCRAYVSDIKARVEATNSFYYPDVMVAFDKHDDSSVYTAHPVLIVEILSRSTATIDRREKVLAYRQIASLREYLIVHQTNKKAELHRRNEQGAWDILEFSHGAELQLESIPVGPLKFPIDAIYEDVDWSQDSDWMVREESEQNGQVSLEW